LPAPSHWTVTFVAGEVISGAKVSSTKKVAVVELVLPQASMAVKVTVAEPVPPHPSLRVVKLLDQVTALQTSFAPAPPAELA